MAAPSFGGYLSANGRDLTDAYGSVMARRVEIAHPGNYYFVDETDTAFFPAIVFLPHGRVFAGWSMGTEMLTNFDAGPFTSARAAWIAAQASAERAADAEADYQATERARIEAEECAHCCAVHCPEVA